MKPEGVQPLVAGQARLLPNIVAEVVKRFNAKMIEEEKPAKQIFSSLEGLLKVATPKKPDVNSTYFNEEYVDQDREYFLLSYGEIFRVNDPYRLYVHMEMAVTTGKRFTHKNLPMRLCVNITRKSAFLGGVPSEKHHLVGIRPNSATTVEVSGVFLLPKPLVQKAKN